MNVHREKGITAYQEARFNEFDQAELILMMFTGAVSFLDKAVECSKTDKRRMGYYISRAKNVLLEIMSSLNLKESGEIGSLLLDTYSRQYRALHQAQMTDNRDKVILVRNSLAEIGDAWKEVFKSEEYLEFKRRRRNHPQGAYSSR